MTPWRLLAVVTAVVVVYFRAIHPFEDIDLYWHVALGREAISGHQLMGAGADWSYGVSGVHWVTTQWLSELVLGAAYSVGGWALIAALRVVVALLVVLGLSRLLLRGHRSPWAAGVFAVTLLVLSVDFQERPQLASLVLLIWLAGLTRRLMTDERVGRLWTVPAFTWLWANLHGLWVLVPAVLAVLAAGQSLEWARRRSTPFPRTAWLLALASTVAAALTPAGPSLLLSPVTFASATRHIQEWQPTTLRDPFTIVFALMVTGLVAAWSRGRQQVRWPELLVVGALVAFASLAMRNVPVSAVLLAPLLLDRLEATWPTADRVDTRREGRALTAVAAATILMGVALCAVKWAHTPTIPDSVPTALARQVADTPGSHRVLNDYNVSGALVFWGGARTTVYVDGRADRYGGAFVDRYLRLTSLVGDWQQTLEAQQPDFALLDRDAQLVRELRRRGWTEVGTQDKYVLLRPARS